MAAVAISNTKEWVPAPANRTKPSFWIVMEGLIWMAGAGTNSFAVKIATEVMAMVPHKLRVVRIQQAETPPKHPLFRTGTPTSSPQELVPFRVLSFTSNYREEVRVSSGYLVPSGTSYTHGMGPPQPQRVKSGPGY